MPRYFFHVHDGEGLDRDHIGTDLPTIEEAYMEAVKVAHDLWHLWDDLPPEDLNNMAVVVVDGAGQTVLTATFPKAQGHKH